MSTEENKAIMRRWLEEATNAQQLEAVDEVFATAFVDHGALPDQPPGPAGIKWFLSMIWSAFPDWRYSIEDMIAEGDKVVARVTVHGTHQGNFLGIPATGTPVTMTEIQIVRVAFGQIVDMWANVDLLGMLQQLGAVPPIGQAS